MRLPEAQHGGALMEHHSEHGSLNCVHNHGMPDYNHIFKCIYPSALLSCCIRWFLMSECFIETDVIGVGKAGTWGFRMVNASNNRNLNHSRWYFRIWPSFLALWHHQESLKFLTQAACIFREFWRVPPLVVVGCSPPPKIPGSCSILDW